MLADQECNQLIKKLKRIFWSFTQSPTAAFWFILLVVTTVVHSATCFASNIYVDRELVSDCTGGNYCSSCRDCSGTDGNAYNTLQKALNNMSPGDTIILRGGTYSFTGTGTNAFEISPSKNGSSWTDGHYNTIRSYDGEWAILDARRHAEVVLGNKGYNENFLKYWLVERLEIRGGSNAGLWFEGGPIRVRYCYIHDNYATSGSANPGGIKGHVLHDSLIEFCYFRNNGMASGSNHNCAHINLYSDYVENPAHVNYEHSVRRNIIRYNYFDDAPVGIKYKNSQWLCRDHTGSDLSRKDYGDRIYNNIFTNIANMAIDARQDFIQIHHNIIDGSDLSIGEAYSGDREPFYACVYNNIVIGGKTGIWHDDDSDGSSYNISSTHRANPNCYFFNNIFENCGNEIDGQNDLNILFTFSKWNESEIDMTKVKVENNLFCPRSDSEEIINLGDNDDDYSASAWRKKLYSDRIFVSQATGLHRAGPPYKCSKDFSVGLNGLNISNGGFGAMHPYLNGVQIPQYIGPSNPLKDSGNAWNPNAPDPDDSGWIDYVLSLSDVNVLESGGSGSGGVPSPPLNLRKTSGN